MENKRRILWLDVAKGICMLSVIAGHLGLKEANGIFFAYHLTVFFILSGFTLKNEFSRESLNKRFRGLMIPYFITCAAVMAMDAVNMVVVYDQTNFKAITDKLASDLLQSFLASGTITGIGDVDAGGKIGAIWFLPALFFASALAQLLLQRYPDRKRRYGAGILLALLAYISARFIWFPFSVQSGVFVVPLLLLGYDLRHSNVLEKVKLPHFLLCLAIFAGGVATGLTKIYIVTTTTPDLILSAVCTLAASLCVYYLSKKLERSRLLAWIGRNSIYFLCVHLFELKTMGPHFQKLLAAVGVEYTPGARFLLELAFVSAVTGGILLCKKFTAGKTVARESQLSARDRGLDVAKAGLIVLMLVGHYGVGEALRDIIYSFHMAAFIFYSGYCFREKACLNMKKTILRQVKAFLIPYALFGVAYILLTKDGLWTELQRVVLGISFSKVWFPEVESIGPVYFILLLFVTKIIYLFLERCIRSELWKASAVLALSLFGCFLGQMGWWLPWSVDCALYCLIFYYLGHCFRKYGIMEYLLERSYSYFVLSCVWAYMIYNSGMEIATREYGNYGLVVLGAVSACVLVYMLCRYLSRAWNGKVIDLICLVGKNTLYILIIHKLLSRFIGPVVSLAFVKSGVYYVGAMVVIQVVLGVLLGLFVEWIRKMAVRK